MVDLTNKEILIGITGGIAAYKVAELTSQLVQQGAGVTVAMTDSAQKFIGKTTFQALTGRPVYTELFEPQEHFIGEHIGLARRADLLLIAPATANVIGRMAHGLADDLLTTLALAVTCPVVIAPAMNNEMWSKPSVQRNLTQLKEDGIHMVGPDEGWLSCQSIGPGRMSSPDAILKTLINLLD
ncbi:bifunctional phosphopantothenoylcysteine decarboxylase/phosphopantothenate--cysteine ligase CoaBC [Thalassoglobus polymorphus]|uniref:Phosphopantothenoylcysteine decarboxylase n=1 Tax=Thalassoglobus polymorphus TaxID=2527994 RepID=A0A517QN19_9PLAN|nr:bifunctional phosphopantothenoylcysteine decarboxylase/phosphopantothenate--cysteine ligase CoaBC [Thalassoglobus polymorphus]QDT33040.1 Phosphopantothenoylcysteine decarboxylase [Thalassoglobus polymorphus]